MRDEILCTTPAEFKDFGNMLHNIIEKGIVKVLASEKAIMETNKQRNDILSVSNIL